MIDQLDILGHDKDDRLIQADLLHPIIKGDENYTPDYFLAPCKEFLGAIDLDPFSCEIANKTIGAVNIYTRKDDALTQDWTSFNRKWVNPPYSAGLIGKAIAKTLKYSHIGETLLLVNTSSSSKWFQSCMEKCAAYLHPSKRINFDSPFRNSKGNRYDQTLFYFGDRPLEFAEALSDLGKAVQPIRLVEDFAIGQFVNTNHCGKNLEIVEINGVILVCKNKQGQQFRVGRKFCSLTSNYLPEQDFPISISGEAILGITGNFKPIEIAEDPIVDESYIKGFKVGDRIRFRDGYKTNLEYELTIGIITDIDVIYIKVIWDGEADSDRYTKFHIAHKQWWEKVDPVSSIDASENIVFVDAIAQEPSKSVANLRMDEGSISVLVEIINDDSVLVESDRYQFLLERREQLIESGACGDGVWINCGKVPRRDFKQAVWKSSSPRPEWNDKKSKYIGEFGKEAHISAIAQHRAGQELRKIEREIRKLQVKS